MENLKILVVEDNKKLNVKICTALEFEGFNMFGAYDVEEALEIFEMEEPVIILLDIMLPDGNGYDLINKFKSTSDCWILMMSALDDIDSKRVSYEVGADDYIVKPFDLFEMIYKLSAIRRRMLKSKKSFIIGDLIINEEVYEISCGEKKIKIPSSRIVFLKLLYFKYLEGTFLSKAELSTEHLEEIEDRNRIQTFVSRVRKDLKMIGCETVIIEAVYGKGYAFEVVESELC